jgi:hypothetical protein
MTKSQHSIDYVLNNFRVKDGFGSKLLDEN